MSIIIKPYFNDFLVLPSLHPLTLNGFYSCFSAILLKSPRVCAYEPRPLSAKHG